MTGRYLVVYMNNFVFSVNDIKRRHTRIITSAKYIQDKHWLADKISRFSAFLTLIPHFNVSKKQFYSLNFSSIS